MCLLVSAEVAAGSVVLSTLAASIPESLVRSCWLNAPYLGLQSSMPKGLFFDRPSLAKNASYVYA